LKDTHPGTTVGKSIGVLNVVVVLGLGLCCLPIMLLLMPNAEEHRSQARLAQAYIGARRLHRGLHAIPPDRRDPLEVDPWKHPYQIVFVDNVAVGVMSLGPNQMSPESGFDADDIYSDMPTSPMASSERRNRFQLSGAVGVAAGVWLLLSAAWLRWRRDDS
jgi:hypothetical protein